MKKYVLLSIKTLSILFILATVAGISLAFKAEKMYSDIWQQLGISKMKGDENIKASFLNGYFSYYGAEKAKNILSGNRAAVARDLMDYVKQQVNSPAFKKEYETMRNQAKPEEPTEKARTKEEVRADEIKKIEQSIKESEKTVKELPDMAKILQPTIDMLKNNLKEYKDPNSKMIDAYYQNEVWEHEQRIRRYKENLAKWEKEYPADHRLLIKKRLEDFLKLARTVDFNAELKTVKDKKKFVNPVYEGKSYDWKMIFRAGKEVIDPAIAFADQWVREIK